MTKASPNHLAEHFFRHNYAKMVAILVRYFGLSEVEIAEDIVQDTLVEAMEKWSIQSIPNNPEGWLMDVAKKKTINFLKRNHNFETKIVPTIKSNTFFEIDESMEKDSMLRMIFTCCHPSLPSESQISLALKTLCGLSVAEIANALLTTESTINKRLYRAKQKFRDNSISFKIPQNKELAKRLDNVFSTLYLLFNEGYYSSHNKKVIRIDLCFEAIRLLNDIVAVYPKSSKAKALLSLMLLSVARFDSRIDEKGAIVILSEQNRNLWDKDLIAQGIEYLHESTQSNQVTIYHLQAGIAAEHCIASSFEQTNWKSIYQQYTLLERLNKSVIITFNKTIAKFYAGHKEVALQELLSLKDETELKKNTHYFTSIGVFYKELNQKEKAATYFVTAIKLSKSLAEKALIETRMDQQAPNL